MGRLLIKWGKVSPVIKPRKELKKYLAKEEYKNLIVQGWSIPSKVGQNKCARAANPYKVVK